MYEMNEIDKKIIQLKQSGYTYSQISNLLNLNINYVSRRGKKKFFETQKRVEVKKIADKEFEQKVIEFLPYSNSLNNLCTNLGLRGVGHYYDKIKKIIEKNNLSTKHFGTLTKIVNSKGRNKYTAMTDEEFFVDGCKRSGKSIIKRLIYGGYKQYKCENPCCGITDWCERPITLQIHHINGNHDDNRLDNLQILCPNCHSQTDNYARCNKTHSFKISERVNEIISNKESSFVFSDIQKVKENWVKKEKKYCKNCGKEIQKKYQFCSQKCSHEYYKKFEASNVDLINSFKELKSFKKVGEKYGVSDKAIKKRCIKNGIIDEVYKYVISRKRLKK